MRNEVSNTTVISDSKKYDKGVLVGHGTYPLTFETFRRIRSDVTRVQPDSQGWRAPTPYVCDVTDRDVFLVTASSEFRNPWNNEVHEYSGILGGSAYSCDLSGISIPNSTKQRVLTQAYLNLDSLKWDISVALLEARESVELIASSARTIARAITQARRRDISGLARTLGVKPPKELKKGGKSAADVWTSFHFGWAPIVSDIVQACVLLSDEDIHSSIRLVARSKAESKTAGEWTEAGALYTADGRFRCYPQFRDEYFKQYSVSLWFSLNAPALRELAKYGLTDPFTTAWAVAPMSFVIDWVLPIGDVLQAYSASRGLSYKGGSNTSFVRGTKKWRGLNLLPDTGHSLTAGIVQPPQAASVSWARGVWPNQPFPTPTYVKDPLDVWKVTTAVALLRQRY